MKLFDFDKTVSYKPKAGAARIVQLFFGNFFELVGVNVLFVVTSLPVFTLGASLAALYKTMSFIVRDEPLNALSCYLHSFKTHFRRGCTAGLLLFIPFLIICFSALFYSELSKSIFAFKFAALLSLSAAFIILLIIPYFFSLITVGKAKFLQLLKGAFRLSIYNMKETFMSFLAFFILTALVFLFFPYTIIVLLLFYFSLCSLFGAYYTRHR